MSRAAFAGRVGAAVAAGALAAMCTVGCSSSTSGSGGGSSSTPPSLTVSVPSVSVPAVPTGGSGAGGSAFCKDFNVSTFTKLEGDPSQIKNYIALIDKITAEAPAAIKADMQQLDSFAHGVVLGKPPTLNAKLTKAAEALGIYVASNCH
jgi:hypothetical protein